MNVTTKVWLFLTLVSMTAILIGYALLGRAGSLFGFLFSILILTCFYFAFQLRSLTSKKHYKLNPYDSYNLHRAFITASEQMQIQMPKVYLFESTDCWAMMAPQAFESTCIYISEGLVDSLNDKEKLAFASLILANLNRRNRTFQILTHLMSRCIYKVGVFLDLINPLRFIVAKKVILFTPFFHVLSRTFLMFAFQKRHTEWIDDEAARALNTPHELAQLLVKMNSWMQSRPVKIDPSLHHLFLIDPSQKSNFFNFHSELKLRVQRLIGYYPI